MISREAVRHALTGPVTHLNTMFTKEGEIDSRGVKAQIDYVIENGCRSVILTWGDSMFTILSDAELGELTKMVVEQTAGRAMVVAGDRVWWTGQATEFARFAREAGADVLMVRPPDFAGAATVETFVSHFASIAKEMPLMVVTQPFGIGRSLPFSLEVIERLYDNVEGIVAAKDDL